MRNSSIVILLCSLVAGTVKADDWPQWLGPRRDSVWRETGILTSFPEGGPKVRWRVPVSWGYGGPAVVGNKVYVMDYVRASGKVSNSAGRRDKLTGKERTLCFNAGNGKLLWKDEYDRPYSLSYPQGPRCTPTVAEGKVYALGAEGNLSCLDAENGRVLWRKDLPKEYRSEVAIWGFSSHPLVDDKLVYCIVGGRGQVAVALDKDTGKEVWRALPAKQPGYCSPTMIRIGGRKQLIIWHPESINALDPASGKVIWSTPLKPGFGVATAVPRQVGKNIFATGAGRVSALLEGATGKVIWRGTPRTSIGCSISTPVVDGDVIYGNDAETGSLMAAQLDEGKRLWQTVAPIDKTNKRGRGPRNATLFIVRNGKQYFLFNDSGELILSRLSPAGYKEISRATILKPTNFTGSRQVVWSHPAFAQKCVFARNDEELVCVSLAAE